MTVALIGVFALSPVVESFGIQCSECIYDEVDWIAYDCNHSFCDQYPDKPDRTMINGHVEKECIAGDGSRFRVACPNSDFVLWGCAASELCQ